MNTEPLSLSERSILATLADTLIPPAPGCLSASEAGIAGQRLDQALSYAPSLADMLRRVIGTVGNAAPQAALSSLKESDAAAYDIFCETIAAIYFLSPEVRTAVGFPGRDPKPARVDVSDLEELLMPVLEAGFAPRAV
jgi:hypothetical protein